MIEDAEAQKVVANNIHMVLATSSKDGTPWISPVFFAHDEQYNLFWFSNREARHSCFIRENPKVAITIFNSQSAEKGAVYFEAMAKELNTEIEIQHALGVLDKKITDDKWRAKLNDVSETAPKRVYRATIVKAYKRIEPEQINGQYVDRRAEIK
ncbi:MAG: pyridoxamine 5'-phosphate oxidase family protein [archaeon]